MEREQEELIYNAVKKNAARYRIGDYAIKGIMIAALGLMTAAVLMKKPLIWKVYEAAVFLALFIQYPSYEKLFKKTEEAEKEISRALKIPGFRFPDAYSPDTKWVREQHLQDQKGLMKQILGFAVLGAAMVFGAAAVVVINLSEGGEIAAWAALVSAILAGLAVFLLAMLLRYLSFRRKEK